MYDNVHTVREAIQRINSIYRSMKRLVDDPMTEAMGAPVEDFVEDYNARIRRLAAFVLRRAKPGSQSWRQALDELERFMP